MKTGQEIIDFIAQHSLVRCKECSPHAVLVWQGQASEQLDAAIGFPSDDEVEEYIRNLRWRDEAKDYEKTLVAGNIRGFVAWLRSPNTSLRGSASESSGGTC